MVGVTRAKKFTAFSILCVEKEFNLEYFKAIFNCQNMLKISPGIRITLSLSSLFIATCLYYCLLFMILSFIEG